MSLFTRRVLPVAVATTALLGLGTGLAFAADSGGEKHPVQPAPPGHPSAATGSGLTGGPTPLQVLKGAPAVPVPDPTLGESTVLPPIYNTLNGVSG